jgi:hypothetical protein
MKKIIFCLLVQVVIKPAEAQTDIDGLMMQKHFFCVGPTAGQNSWKKYWEGTFKRENANIGKLTTTNYMVMGNYGITGRLNFLFGLPYIKTKASAGNMAGQKGLQDLALWLKWVVYEKHIAHGDLKGILIGGYSTPVSHYTADFFPMSIGMQSKNATLRLMTDYQRGNWFGTLSWSYVFRSNVTIDRYTYYTTEMHYSNEVRMPDASEWNLRLGYRSSTWIIEAVADKWTTLGGFDIPKNGMPFVSNKMNATKLGMNVKYETPLNGLSIIANGNTTVAGRNVGQSTGFNAGLFYIMDFGKKTKTSKKTTGNSPNK